MEKTFHPHYLSPSPLSPNKNRHGTSQSSMRFPIVQKISSSNRIISPLNPKFLCVQKNTILKNTMADQSKSTQSPDKSEPEKRPEPPEKPLPGDCCGSGCVRCVWDIYYEELEEYNKLCKSKSDSLSNINKPS